MNCTRAEKLLPEFLLELLSPAESGAVASHLEGCVVCRAKLAELQAADQALREAPRPVAPRDFAERVLRRLPTPTGVRPRLVWQRPVWLWSACAAAVMLGLVVLGPWRISPGAAMSNEEMFSAYTEDFTTLGVWEASSDTESNGTGLYQNLGIPQDVYQNLI